MFYLRSSRNIKKFQMISLSLTFSLAIVSNGQTWAQFLPPVDMAAVDAGPYSPEFFTSPPMLQKGGTEEPAAGNSAILTWSTIPTPFEVIEVAAFELPNGNTHWYEVVYLPEGGVNWV